MPFSLRLDPETESRIRRLSTLTGRSKSQVVREAVARYAPDEQPVSADDSTFERMKAHLAANGVDIGATPAVLGPWLEMDPRREKIDGNGPANAMLRGEYREPYVVPERP